MARSLLLVLDEPCAGIDPGVRERFLAWLDKQVRTETAPTTILVTHHIEEIVPGIQNTLILSAGRIHSCGATHDVVTRDTIEAVYHTRLARIERSGGRLWPLWGQ
jgi:iron complex transport system ATP-binding protein